MRAPWELGAADVAFVSQALVSAGVGEVIAVNSHALQGCKKTLQRRSRRAFDASHAGDDLVLLFRTAFEERLAEVGVGRILYCLETGAPVLLILWIAVKDHHVDVVPRLRLTGAGRGGVGRH